MARAPRIRPLTRRMYPDKGRLIFGLTGRRLLAALLVFAMLAVIPNLPPHQVVRANPGPTNAGSTTTNSSSANRLSATFTHTVPAGTNRILIVVICLNGLSVVNSVTYNLVALTRAIQTDSANSSRGQVQIWYLVAPPEITANVTVTYSANQPWDGITVLNYTGVHQTAPIGNTLGAIGNSSTPSVSLTTKLPDSLLVAGINGSGGSTSPMTPGAGVTERSDFSTGTGGAGADGGCWTGERAGVAGNTAYTLNATMGASARWVDAAIELVPPSISSVIAFQSFTDNHAGSGTPDRSSATFSHTTPDGNQRLLVVIIHQEGNRSVTGVTYGLPPVALTMKKTQNSGSTVNTQIQIWTLISPPVGNFNVVVTYGQSQDWDAIVALSYTGVDQTTPVGATAGATAAASTYPATTITSTVAGSVILGAVAGAGGTTYPMRPGGGQNERYDGQTGTNATAGSDAGYEDSDMSAPTTGTYGFGATMNLSRVATVAAVELRPAPPDISNSLPSYNFGNVSEGSSTLSGLTRFTLTNHSGYAINVTVSGTDMTGGTAWTLSDTATPGTNIYGLKAGLADNSDYNVVVRKNAPYNILMPGMASGETAQWGIMLLAPTTFSDEVTKTGTVTLTAAAA